MCDIVKKVSALPEMTLFISLQNILCYARVVTVSMVFKMGRCMLFADAGIILSRSARTRNQIHILAKHVSYKKSEAGTYGEERDVAAMSQRRKWLLLMSQFRLGKQGLAENDFAAYEAVPTFLQIQ